MKSRREDCRALLSELLEKYTMEQIAVKVGVTASTIYYWKTGRAVPMLAVKVLKGLLK